ncbi:RNA polymerase subunit sigma-24, partial [Pandoraea nosoerga]|nr:RNA polymerase subunit sigma-24 [Pandoraea nosoerga]
MSAYGPGLRRFFKRRANPSDVDDLVQDVFVRLHSAQLREPIENVEGYLFTVARHVLVSRHRAECSRTNTS